MPNKNELIKRFYENRDQKTKSAGFKELLEKLETGEYKYIGGGLLRRKKEDP